ncbi:Hep/Hag repeat protein [Megasphaera lornae]|uniref:Hep/Hag repeat protein n=2 Tax=Megasphaera TaxID=906 RepID=D3LVN7_9FIRM|nr:ESPR-type extended signal peptide-containing protein [Megasphaera genomosp. type_1]EFD93690.1 Hep/Hag repeat protein [Megasphaera genomosp. type_1 str. 28L]
MNKVYQVIWSRVRHCYMAVAETVARSHYKHSSKSAAKATWAAVAAAGLLTGIPAFSMAQGSTIAAPNQVVRTAEGQALTKDNGKAKKAATPVFSNKELKKLTERVTFPMNFMVTDGGTDGVYVTEQRYNNDLKGEHIVLGEGSVAFDRQKGYSGLFAAGINAVAGGKDAIAIGNQASATGNNFSIAIGSNAEAPMSNSIALGEGSIANLKLSQQGKQSYLTKEDWNGDYNGVLSLGRDLSGARAEVTRRIIHVAGGAADTDAVNVKQLKALEAKIPKAVDLSKYTTTDKLGAVIEQKLGDTYAKKADIPAAKTFKAVGDGISVTEKDNVITYTLDTSKLPQSSTGVYVTEQRYNNDLKGEHIALGEGSVAFDQQKGYSGLFAAGINAVAGGKDAIAIGNKASATGNTFSIAIGSNAEAPMSNSIALGEGSIANLTLSQQGKQSYLTKEDWNGDYNGVLSLGRDLSGARAEVTRRIIHVAGGAADTDAVNVKQLKALEATLHFSYISIKGTKKDKGTNYNNDGATGNEAIAIGQESQATGNSGIAIGVHSKVMGLENNNLIKGDYGTAIGAWASVKNNDATALGAHTHAWGERSLAIGDRSVGNGIESVAIGSQALADSFNAIAIGGNSSANLENAIAIGKKSKTEGMTSIAIGSEASTGQKGDAQKSKERVKELKNDVRKQLNDPIIHKAENAIAIGTQAKAWQTKAVSLGAFAKAQERESLALGDKSFANGIESVAIGHNSSAQHISAIALGDSSLSEGIQSIAIGKNAQAGNKDEAFKSKQQLKKIKSEHKDITNDDIINASFGAIAIGSGAKSLAMHAMSLGLNAKATAVNSIALGFNSEAKSVTHVTKAYGVDETWDFSNGVLSIGRDAEENKKAITRRITHIASGGDDYDAVNVKQLKAVEAKIPKAVDLSKYTPTDKLGDVIAQKLGDTYAKKTDIPAAKTFKVAGAGFSVEDKDNVVTYTLDINKLKTQLSGSSSAGTNGKSAYEVWEEYTDGNGAQPNKGKKESDFLASLKGKDGTNGTNGKSAYEVWEEHKDVNGAQPNKGKSESDFLASLKGKDGTNGITAAQLEQVSQGMQTRMAALGKHMNSVGAGNAALAALHPLEFDPDDKLEAAVGVGHYGDANAAALGMFYHPDENTLISVGGAFGKDKNVMNAGISFRVGKGGNGMLLTKTALATAVKQQNIVIHQQEERIRQLERENKARDAKLAEVLQALAQVKR